MGASVMHGQRLSNKRIRCSDGNDVEELYAEEGDSVSTARRRAMEFDRNHVTPGGKTYAQIDAEQAEYVRLANAALSSVRDKDVHWSSYTPSHHTFEMLVGEPDDDDNIVLSLPACNHLAGPVQWPTQRLEVVWRCEDESGNRIWEFEIRDESVGFRAIVAVFRWRRGHDLWVEGGLWFGHVDSPTAPLSCEQAETALAKLLRHFYNGSMRYTDLRFEMLRVLDQLPAVTTRPGAAGDSRGR